MTNHVYLVLLYWMQNMSPVLKASTMWEKERGPQIEPNTIRQYPVPPEDAAIV